jgi:hypothetical protein
MDTFTPEKPSDEEIAYSVLKTENIHTQIEDIVNATEGGYIDELKALVALKELERHIKEALGKVDEKATSEAEKYRGQNLEVFGAKLEVRKTAGRWDYSNIPEIQEKKSEIKELEKEAQQAYHAYLKGSNIVTNDGEVKPFASYRDGKEKVFVTLPKK